MLPYGWGRPRGYKESPSAPKKKFDMHKHCPECGSEALIGVNPKHVECTRPGCVWYRAPDEDGVVKGYDRED